MSKFNDLNKLYIKNKTADTILKELIDKLMHKSDHFNFGFVYYGPNKYGMEIKSVNGENRIQVDNDDLIQLYQYLDSIFGSPNISKNKKD